MSQVSLIQLPILFTLFFVLMFGIGFILNMLIKTTWLPLYLFMFVLLPVVVFWRWDGAIQFSDNLLAFQFIDYLVAIAGILGAFISGQAIKTLRVKGYKMF
ncbi:YuiB family protein [Longirhabdus pacifica]|uniref:YuiB family protein n=1 Tax=Longirhabdus pacifica TaxID=2305227 RepID=UPI001008CE33|nr:YuiB family protein [Longirhabdus pacifica]